MALRLQKQKAKEACKAKRQLKIEAKELQRSKKARTKRREVVVDIPSNAGVQRERGLCANTKIKSTRMVTEP